MTNERRNLGFGDALDELSADDFAPRHHNGAGDRPSTANMRESAEISGFSSREPETVIRRQRGFGDEPVRQVGIRLPLSYANRLTRYSNENDISFPKLLMKLMDENNI